MRVIVSEGERVKVGAGKRDRKRAGKVAKSTLAPVASGQKYDGQTLLRLAGAGRAHELSDRHLVPLDDAADVLAAVAAAKAGLGRKTPEDSAAFRSAIERRSAALGLAAPQWSVPAAKAAEFGRLAKAAADPGDRRHYEQLAGEARAEAGPEKLSKSQRLGLLEKSAAYSRMADVVADPAARRDYLELAAEAAEISAGVR